MSGNSFELLAYLPFYSMLLKLTSTQLTIWFPLQAIVVSKKNINMQRSLPIFYLTVIFIVGLITHSEGKRKYYFIISMYF